MVIETKEQFLERMLARKRPQCPACQQDMEIWEVPSMTFSDGLGWGVPYLFVCFNEDCPTYTQGWDHFSESYGHTASCRNVCYPDSDKFECMPVFSSQGGTGQIVTEEVLAEEDRIKEATKQGFYLLAGFYTEQRWIEVLRLLVDVTQPARVRLKAAEMMGDIGDPEAVEPLRNFTSGNNAIDTMVGQAITKIHERNFTMECPYCAEIIKKRAKACKHCGKEQ
jgi:predicted RNA-binding Zn-ribbon protein involved in translation (DUF1610 family)